MSEPTKKLTIDDKGLENLFNEIYGGALEDIDEATDWVEQIMDKISTKPTGIEQYGELYSMALQAKGNARDRLLKLANQVRDRVKSKEGSKDETGLEAVHRFMSPEKIQETILEAKKKIEEKEALREKMKKVAEDSESNTDNTDTQDNE